MNPWAIVGWGLVGLGGLVVGGYLVALIGCWIADTRRLNADRRRG